MSHVITRFFNQSIWTRTAVALCFLWNCPPIFANGLSLSGGMDFSTGNYGGSSATDIWYAPFTARYDHKKISFRTTIPYLNLTGPGNVLGPGIGGTTIGDGGTISGLGGGSLGGGSGGVLVCDEEDGDCSTTEDDPDQNNGNSGSGGDSGSGGNSGSGGDGSDPDDDNSGSGGGGSDPDDDDNSGSGGGGSDPDDDDNSGSGGGGSDPDDDDNSGSGGGGSDPDDDDNSGSGGGGSDPDNDNSGSGGGGSDPDDDNSGSGSNSLETDESHGFESALNQIGISSPSSGIGGFGSSDAPRSNHAGLGDIVTALTYNVLNHEPTGIIFDITGRLKIPTASAANNLGTGQIDYAIQGDLIKSMSRFMFSASFGYRILGNPSGVNFHNVFYGAAGIAFKLTADSTIGSSFNMGQSPVRLQDSRDFTLYVSHRLNDNFRLNLYGLRGASERSPDWGGGINLRYVF